MAELAKNKRLQCPPYEGTGDFNNENMEEEEMVNMGSCQNQAGSRMTMGAQGPLTSWKI